MFAEICIPISKYVYAEMMHVQISVCSKNVHVLLKNVCLNIGMLRNSSVKIMYV